MSFGARSSGILRSVEPTRSERGSAVAEFVMVTTLLVVIAMTLVQLALVLHVRNTLIDAASNGAHYGAPSGTVTKVSSEIKAVTGGHEGKFARDIAVSTTPVGDSQLVTVSVSTRVPLIGLLPNGWDLHVEGEAVRYG